MSHLQDRAAGARYETAESLPASYLLTGQSDGDSDSFAEFDPEKLYARQSEKWSRHPSGTIPSFIAEMDFPIAPPVLRAICVALDRGDLGYAFSFTTSSPAHQALSSWAESAFGWRFPSRMVLLYADVMRAIEASLDAFTERGDGIVVDTPGYPPLLSSMGERQRELIVNRMTYRNGRWNIDFDGLERAFRGGAAAYVLCNPHNPTGRVLEVGELRRVAELAAAHRVFVISDEIHSPLVYPDRAHVPIAILPEARRLRVMTTISATKGWNIAGLKCGFCIPDGPEAHEALMAMPTRTRDGIGILGVYASIAAFSAGMPWLRKVIRYLDGNRRLLADLLTQHLPEVGYAAPEGTYLGWLDFRRTADCLSGYDLSRLILERGQVALSDGREFGYEGFFRINFATYRSILVEIVQRIATSLRDPTGRPPGELAG